MKGNRATCRQPRERRLPTNQGVWEGTQDQHAYHPGAQIVLRVLYQMVGECTCSLDLSSPFPNLREIHPSRWPGLPHFIHLRDI